MSLQTWWLFCVAVFVVAGTPGPNMLHVMTRSIRFGPRRSVAAMAGCIVAIMMVLSASAAGLGALLIAAPMWFDAIRYFGMAYLAWLGIKAWTGSDAPFDIEGDLPATRLSGAALFRGGFLISISNPKLILFAVAFLPQFMNPAAPKAPQLAILVATFAVIESFWYAVYALGGRKMAERLKRPGLRKWLNRLTGTIFMGFGLALLGVRAG